MDPIRLRRPERLAAVLARAPAPRRHPGRARAHPVRDHVRRPPAARRWRSRVDGAAGRRAAARGSGRPARRPSPSTCSTTTAGSPRTGGPVWCCSPSTPPPRWSPSPCTTAPTWSPSWRPTLPMKHGEQLAPLIAGVLERAGIVRQDLTAIGVGVGPGPFTGLRVGLVTARTLGVRPRDPGLRRVHARRARRRGGRAPARSTATSWSPRTRAARRSTWRRTTWTGAGSTARRRQAGRARDGAAGAWARAPGSTPRPSRTPSGRPGPSAGWLAHAIAEERAELLDPEPLYLRRPDAAVPSTPQAGVVSDRARRDAR